MWTVQRFLVRLFFFYHASLKKINKNNRPPLTVVQKIYIANLRELTDIKLKFRFIRIRHALRKKKYIYKINAIYNYGSAKYDSQRRCHSEANLYVIMEGFLVVPRALAAFICTTRLDFAQHFFTNPSTRTPFDDIKIWLFAPQSVDSFPLEYKLRTSSC